MSQQDLSARAQVTIAASRWRVWDGLVNPAIVEQYMMGARVESEWKQGSEIIWKGEWKGKPFEDRGTVLEVKPGYHLKYSRHSGAGSAEPTNRHDVTIDLSGHDGAIRVDLAQRNNHTAAERARSEKSWELMLSGLKDAVEAANR